MSTSPDTVGMGGTSRCDDGIHLAIDLSAGSALSWVAGELAVALSDIGQRVSLPPTGGLSPTLEPRLRARLPALMAERPCRTYHVKLNHYWPQFLMQEISGEINAELFVTNYRFRGEIHPLDMWSRNLVTNGVRKLPMSTFCRDSLTDLGVPADQCAVVPPGYSPEIESLFPRPRPPRAGGVRRLFVVTNSHDLNRYGTDILVRVLAKAFGPQDPVEIHIKDYGASSGSRTLRESIAAHPSFPTVVWHEEFLGKENLIRLYGEMDLMLCPFRGEGYAMKIIDAMAVGLPVMMPAFGGPMEYAPPAGFLPLPFDEIPIGPCLDTDQYLVGPGAFWCEVREDAFVEALRSYLSSPAAADEAAAVARAHVYGRFTWAHAARCLVSALEGWQREKQHVIARRRRSATRPLSVIIPTKDRPVELAKTLQGYRGQTDDSFEIVLVNDHGDGRSVRDVVAAAGNGLRVVVIDNDGRPGPGAARNRGLAVAEGDVVLVTGDDIIPAPELVARHRDAHRLYPDPEDAFVGKIVWHPDMEPSWFTDHIVGAGGQQFAFGDVVDGQELSYRQFYTSNISWKRTLTADCEQIFSESFRDAAFEDIELGYRLSRRGLRLRYLDRAEGRHLHPMTPRSFFARMRRVGWMRTVLASIHPGMMPQEDNDFFLELEVERRRRLAGSAGIEPGHRDDLLEPFVKLFEELDDRLESPQPLAGAAGRAAAGLDRRLGELRRSLFDELCDSFMRLGQAEEWARGSADEAWVAAWVASLRRARLGATPAAQPPNHTQSPPPPGPPALPGTSTRTNPLKRWLLQYRFARKIQSSVREWKRRRRVAQDANESMLGCSPGKKITPEDVVWCFANILGRHPHTAAETTLFLEGSDDFEGLVRKLVAKPEFVTRRVVATDWFVYDDSPDVQRRVLGILERLQPMRAPDLDRIRLGKELDGGYVMLDDFIGIGAAYSIGICGDVSWDLAMAERGIDVFQYDHTIEALPVVHPRFHWEKKGLGPVAMAEFETLPGLVEKNGHRGRNDLILKCDIEGCEWEVLAALPDRFLRQFKQIVLEVHFLERLVDPAFADLVERAVRALTADHRVVHVHANNHRPYSIVGGLPLPSVLELSLVRAADTRLEKSDETYPTSLDTPCYAGRADFRLGTFRY